MRKIILLFSIVLPSSLKKLLFRYLLGWKIGNNVKIGFSYINSKKVVLGNDVTIGHFNVIHKLKNLEIADRCYIANFNQFFGNYREEAKWTTEIILAEKVLIMSHHFMDVAGTITIGSNTTIGGRDTHFWTHSRILEQGIPKLVPMNIKIGNNVYIGARTTLISCDIPDWAIVGAGSLVNKSFSQESNPVLIAGNPATIKKRYELSEDNLLSNTL
jgi:acetyltransferase-like isoleucine patch superfamily enzyme